ncbi:DinB family protein [Dokdonia sinensis]|uniref:DinB family protein n=1 Tax=Dokdonia sinensis TaxID=2479847 RepID=A0A3M0GDK2_9FLAO|nr:DinB family protein [Dokdonia sinensis]RMB59229.1 DinB family protein [Dokdonia sinensis]
MNKIFLLLLCVSLSAAGQQDNFKGAFLEKWDNSRDYLIEIAEAMPADGYDFRPTERQMTFNEQLEHIQGNISWLSSKYFNASKIDSATSGTKKDQILENLKRAFASARVAIENTPEADFKTTVDFFAGPKSKLQILNLLHDHLSHHRGQLIVYLNLNEIEPPSYSGW